MMLLQPLPDFRLRGEDKINDHSRIEAKLFVVVLRSSPPVSARRILIPVQRLNSQSLPSGISVRPACEQSRFDGLLQTSLGNIDHPAVAFLTVSAPI